MKARFTCVVLYSRKQKFFWIVSIWEDKIIVIALVLSKQTHLCNMAAIKLTLAVSLLPENISESRDWSWEWWPLARAPDLSWLENIENYEYYHDFVS